MQTLCPSGLVSQFSKWPLFGMRTYLRTFLSLLHCYYFILHYSVSFTSGYVLFLTSYYIRQRTWTSTSLQPFGLLPEARLRVSRLRLEALGRWRRAERVPVDGIASCGSFQENTGP